jgi:DNA repair exonuclease SbcCD nuclease subunit
MTDIHDDATSQRSFVSEDSAFAVQEGESIISLSDLHYGVHQRQFVAGVTRSYTTSPNYEEEEITAMILDAISRADHVVLNGDIFEMVYSKGEDRQALLKDFSALMDVWIHAAQAKPNGCVVHMVQGNHDDASDLEALLQEKMAEHPNHFRTHPVALRLGSAFFTHGDLPLRQSQHAEINVETRLLGWESPMGTKNLPKPARPWVEYVAKTGNALIHSTAERARNILIPAQSIVNDLYAALCDSPLLNAMTDAKGNALPAVTDIITGHTHHPFREFIPLDNNNMPLSDIHFHNTGTALKRDMFHPLCLTVGESQSLQVSPIVLQGQYREHEMLQERQTASTRGR